MRNRENDSLDHPELNLCPECGSYFAADSKVCPICGAACPESFRAGSREPKKARYKENPFMANRGSTRVTFVAWYYSWWFIVFMLIFMPLVGIVLLITSPHKTSLKVGLAAAGAAYMVLMNFGVGTMITTSIRQMLDKPIDTKMTCEAYTSACTPTDAETFYRSPGSYQDQYVKLEVVVKEKILDAEAYYNKESCPEYYVCTARVNHDTSTETEAPFEILVRDCASMRREGDRQQNFIAGDVINVYGEGAGNVSFYDMEGIMHSAPCIHMAYAYLAAN